MATATRDRISVDLRGLKEALLERARAVGVSPSELVRTTLSRDLEIAAYGSLPRPTALVRRNELRVRISMRMSREDATCVMSKADAAGLPIGSFITALARGAAVGSGKERGELVSALTQSCAELAAFRREIQRSRRSSAENAVVQMADRVDRVRQLDDHVRRHLFLASELLAELRSQLGHVPRKRERGSK